MKNKQILQSNDLSKISRRQLLKLFGATAATWGLLGASKNAFSKSAFHLVIVGGGIGGAASAKYMRLLNKDVKITIIEPNIQYMFCPGSNEVIPGWAEIEELIVSYTTLKERYGINFIHDKADTINYEKKQLKLASGEKIAYDKLIVSPGPTFLYNSVEGFSEELAYGDFPAAWHVSKQTITLRNQIHSLKKGGSVIISSPKDPYRCPPAPYERASFIASYLKENNPTAKLLILDSKDHFIFENNYPHYWKKEFGFGTDNALIEWVSKSDGGEVTKLDASNHSVTTADGTTHKADVINIIPPEKAGAFALKNGLAEGDWCPVEFSNFESTIHKDVHVIGDSVDGDPMPKTGYIASNQARVLVQAINDEIHGRPIGTPFIINDCVAMAGKKVGMTLMETFRYAGKGKRMEERYIIPGPSKSPTKNIILKNMAKNWQRTFHKDIFS